MATTPTCNATMCTGYYEQTGSCAGPEPYDFLSMAPIIEFSGSAISDGNGLPLRMESDGPVVAAATRELHRKILVSSAAP